jgi:hypothetical protein
MKKQTAVEWLVKQINEKIDFIPMHKWDEIRDIVQQAKEMEKEQVINSRLSVFQDLNKMPYGMEYLGNLGDALEDANEYYNAEYKGGKQ